MSAIRSCRTAGLRGHVARCADCANVEIAYNSCRNRHCPKYQGQRLETGSPPVRRICGSFGAGLGLFIAPNNQVAIAAVPPALSGPAGSLLNLMRALGTSLGVTGGAIMLALNLNGPDGTWLSSSDADMLIAVRHSLPLLGVIVVLAGMAAWYAAQKVESLGERSKAVSHA